MRAAPSAAGNSPANRSTAAGRSRFPSEYTDGEGNRYVVYVRRDALSRGDLSALDRNLEAKLCAKQARDTPVCPVREECFSEAFDELIRQVILECPERGLLLARARDQLRMTLAAYMTVYQDRCAATAALVPTEVQP